MYTVYKAEPSNNGPLNKVISSTEAEEKQRRNREKYKADPETKWQTIKQS